MTPIGSFPGEIQAARHTKGHSGTGCTLPSDSLTAAQVAKMSGEVRTVRLRPGLKWSAFCALNDRMQSEYIKTMVEHGARPKTLGYMFGVSDQSVRLRIKALGLPLDRTEVSTLVQKEKDKEWDEWCAKCAQEDAEKEVKVREQEKPAPVISTSVNCGSTILGGSVMMTGMVRDVLARLADLIPDAKVEISVEYKVL